MSEPSAKEKKDVVTIHVPSSLFQLMERRAKEVQFPSTEEYILFVLEEVTKGQKQVHGDQKELSAEEEGKISDRLRGMGYIE